MRTMVGLALILMACSGKRAPSATPPPRDASSADASPLEERWAATAVVGARLVDFVVRFAGADATIAIGGTTLPLTEVARTGDQLRFTLVKPGAPASATERFALTVTGDRADGTDTIGGQALPVRMVRLDAGEAPRSAFARPQTPLPPFPYQARDVVVDAPDGGKLAGTLTIPAEPGPHPALLLLSGSGQQDRDETIFGHRPFLVIADHLTRAGWVVARFDDRGTGRTVGAPHSLDTEIADAGAMIDFLAGQPEVDRARVGVLGHSAAGMVVPSVALHHPVAFAVLLAACTRSGRDYAAFQTEHSARLAGASDAQLAVQREAQARVTAAALEGPDAVRRELTRVLGATADPATLERTVAQTTDPWMVSYLRIDPRDAWKRLHIPVLLMSGRKDTQVPTQLTVDGLAEVYPAPLLTVRTLDDLNHLFQPARTGEVDEYLTIDTTFDPAALAALTDWLAALPAR